MREARVHTWALAYWAIAFLYTRGYGLTACQGRMLSIMTIRSQEHIKGCSEKSNLLYIVDKGKFAGEITSLKMLRLRNKVFNKFAANILTFAMENKADPYARNVLIPQDARN